MAEIVPYQPGMRLGRTFDLPNFKIGQDIYPEECSSAPFLIEHPATTIQYSVIKNYRDIANILGVSAEISLKVMAGIIKTRDAWKCLNEDQFDTNTVVVLARAQVETLTETLTSHNPKQNWKENLKGTHYVRSMTYGGDLVFRICIKESNHGHLNETKETSDIDGIRNIRAESDSRNIEQTMNHKSEIDVDCFSTISQVQKPTDFDSVLKALDNFKHQVRLLNDGKGTPIKCELLPLLFLDQDVPRILQYKRSDLLQRELENRYSDFRQAKYEMDRFLQRKNCELSEKHNETANKIITRIKNVLTRFNILISEISVSNAWEMHAKMKSAFDYYRENKKFGGFRLEVQKFIQTLSAT